jgi:hypothetical protein
VVSECLLRIGAKTKKRGDMTSEDVAPPPPGTYFCHCKRNARQLLKRDEIKMETVCQASVNKVSKTCTIQPF